MTAAHEAAVVATAQARQRTATGLPGQVRTLEVLREGKGWLFLDWKEPVDGGRPAAYKVRHRSPGTV